MVVRIFNGTMQVVERTEFTDASDADFKGNIDKPVSTVIAGTGAADSGKIIKLDANGLIDPTLIPATAAISGMIGIHTSTASIDLKAVAATTLWTVPGGINAVITGLMLRITAITAITVDPEIGVGIAAGEDDIMYRSPLIGIQSGAADMQFNCAMFFGGLQAQVSPADVVKLGVDVGATGTTLTVTADLLGYVIP